METKANASKEMKKEKLFLIKSIVNKSEFFLFEIIFPIKSMVNKDELFLFEMRNKLMSSELGYFENTRGNDNATNLSR